MTRRNFKFSVLFWLAAFLSTGVFAFVPSGLLEIHQINVGQGQSTLVIGPDGTTVLLDAGRNGQGPNIVDYLQFVGVMPADGLDYTIAGHMDSDHVGGFDEVVQSGYDVRFGNWFNGSPKETQSVLDYKAAMAGTTAGGPIPALLGDTIALGNGALLTVVAVNGEVIGFGPVPGALNNENDMSVAVVIEYGDFDYIWASDLGGGADDNACTGRSTSQVNVETPLAQSITPGGAFPMLSAEGVDVMTINHHGSESSTNSDYMNLLKPETALIPVGEGQGSNFHHPRIDVVEHVLMAQVFCVSAPPALVLQTEEGDPVGSQTSFAGFAVGDIKVSTDGVSNYTIEATGVVAVGPDERAAAGLPRTMPLDEGGGGGNTSPTVTITTPGNGSSFESGASVTFTGTASDVEDGDLTANLSWTSDLDGAIGSGGSFSTSALSVGNHTITATVTDSGGLTGSTSIGVTIFVPGGGGGLVLSEVLYDVSGSDDGFEWVELYNSGSGSIDLSGYSLGNGGSNYTVSKVQLSGVIGPGQTFVVGGPSSGASNGSPVFDQVVNFNPDFQNSGTAADGVALFDVPAAQVNLSTVPIDAVVYGPVNSNGLIDETGVANPPEVGDAAPNSSIERVDLAGSWQIQSVPNPNSTALPPPSGGNTAPSVSITAPLDGSSFDEGSVITFTGSASDAEDGDLTASLTWTSDLDGSIGAGGSFTATLSVGVHTVTASVTDSGGLSGSDSIAVTVNSTNTAPSVSITAPPDGTTIDEGTTINFTGTASDAEDGDLTASIGWSSSLDGALGTGGSVVAGSLSAGVHTITASVTDSGGLSDSAAITVTVNSTGPVTVTFESIASEDGWVRESNENSGVGGKNSSGGSGSQAIRLGDDNKDRQYKSILSFDTSSIPDGATIDSVTLRIRRGNLIGNDPFNTHGSARVDVQTGGFSGNVALQNGDFEAVATAAGSATLSAPAANGDLSEAVLDAAGRAALNLTGTTQFRIAFDLDDNDNSGNDYMGYYSGEDGTAENRPQLEVTYTP